MLDFLNLSLFGTVFGPLSLVCMYEIDYIDRLWLTVLSPIIIIGLLVACFTVLSGRWKINHASGATAEDETDPWWTL